MNKTLDSSIEPQAACGKSRWMRLAELWFASCWIASFFGLIGVAFWVASDSLFDDTVYWTADELGKPEMVDIAASVVARQSEVESRQVILKATSAVLGLATFFCISGIFVGPKSVRRLLAWIGLFSLVSGWASLAVYWQDLAWYGSAGRMVDEIDRFDSIAADLREDWPLVDGRDEILGAYSAYPYGRARMLMRLTQPDTGEQVSFAAIEKSNRGALRFQLTGIERGRWLEWHPDGSVPDHFTGELGEPYRLKKYSALPDGWYFAEYQ